MTNEAESNHASEMGPHSGEYAGLGNPAPVEDQLDQQSGALHPETRTDAGTVAELVEHTNNTVNNLDETKVATVFNDIHATTDYDLLSWAAKETLEQYPLSVDLIAELLEESGPEVKAELATLLLSLYQSDAPTRSQESPQAKPPYRFENFRVKNAPNWLRSGSPHSYVRSIMVECITQHMLASDWVRPARFHLNQPSNEGEQ